MEQMVSRTRNTTLHAIFLKVWFPVFAAITIIGLIVPLNPVMPRGGLDPSWVMSMNEAAAEHMRFGHDVIFTFGPYAAFYSEFYHPALDHLVLLSSLIFALCYLGALLYLVRKETRAVAIIFLIFLGWFLQSRDALLFSYPLLLALCVVKFSNGEGEKRLNRWQWLLSATALCVPLGMLPLVKGNMIVLCGAIILLLAGYLLYQKHVMLAAVTVAVPAVSLLLFWTFVGQGLNGLADYASSSAQILAGYTEAMGMQGQFRGILAYLPDAEVVAYVIAAAAVLWILAGSKVFSGVSKGCLVICFTLFLFVGFKSGFVRHDAHVLVAVNSLVFASILIGFVRWDRSARVVFALCAVLFAGITVRYSAQVIRMAKTMIPHYKEKETSAKSLSDSKFEREEKPPSVSHLVREAAFGVYGQLWDGLRIRLLQKDGLSNEYREGIAKIREQYPVPKMAGTLDIYPVEQAYILASDDIWDPRPVIQSYAAWTPKLALINEQHLRTENAPDHILFRVSPDDQHLPSLDDGISWIAFLDNYTVAHSDGLFAYLNKREIVKSQPDLKVLQDGVYKTGESVTVATAGGPIFAEINLEPTLFGRLVATVFKPTQVRIVLKLADGTKRDYRVLPNMMKTGFCVSPLVEDTQNFVQLISGDRHLLGQAAVKEMTIFANHPTWMIWKDHYTLKLKEYRGGAW